MAVIYGKFDNISQSNIGFKSWDNVTNANDGTSETFAYVHLDGEEVAPGAFYDVSEDILLTNHNIDTTGHDDYLVKLEIGITCKTNPEYLFDNVNWFVKTLAFGIYYDEPGYEILIEVPTTTTNETIWVDVTPYYSEEMDWNFLNNMKCFMFGVIQSDTTGTFEIYVDEVQLKITTDTKPIGVYGLECFDETGNIILSTSDRITRVVWQKIVERDENDSEVIDLPMGDGQLIGFGQVVDDNGGMAHSVNGSVSNNQLTLSWTANKKTIGIPAEEAIPSARTLITVLGW